MEVTLKIRGIYTTALTKFFMDRGVTVALPSKEIAIRFGSQRRISYRKPVGAEISDCEDRQGIVVSGHPAQVRVVVHLIKEGLIDAICRKTTNHEFDTAEIEFPYMAKSALDEIRNRIVPTVSHHHRLRIIASEYVDLMEQKTLSSHPEKREVISRDLEDTLIWKTFGKGKIIGIDHVKLDGQVISLSEGEIIQVLPKEKKLILKRAKFSGRARYDGLNISKREGDYAVSEVKGGAWFYTHTYFRQDGQPIGAYYNINTPVEFYPDKIRYVDLETDVVKWPDGKVEIIDQEELDRQFALGYLSEELRHMAEKTAYELTLSLHKNMARNG